MKSINKILILFVLVMCIAFYAVWEFLQSEWVAKRISVIATTYAEEVLNSDIEFESLRFKLFPPGADLKEFKIKGEKSGISFSAEVNKLGIYFDPVDVFSTTFSIDEIVFNDGYLKLDTLEKSKKKTKSSPEEKENNKKQKKDITEVFEMLKAIPINNVSFKDYYLDINNNKLETTYLYLANKKSYVAADGLASDISIRGVTNKKIDIDEVGFKVILNPQKLVIEKLSVKKDLGRVDISGNVLNYNSSNIEYKLQSEIGLPLMMINDIVDFSNVGRIYNGHGKIFVKMNGKGKDYDSSITINSENVDSDFAYADKLKGVLRVNPERINFETFKLIAGEQRIDLQKPFEFFNLVSKKWVEEPIVIKAKSLRTDNFLRFLKDKLSLIDGTLSGEVRFVLGKNFYTFFTGDNVKLERLILKPGDKKIFELNDLNLDYGNFTVKNKVFTMDMIASDGNTSFNLNGEISSEKFFLKMPESNFDLAKVSPIVDFNIEGDGKLGFELKRLKNNHLVMLLDGKFKDVSFEGYGLDQVESSLVFDFNSSNISLKKLIGRSNKSKINAKGVLNYKTKKIDTSFSIDQMNFTEVKRIFKKHLGDMSITSNEIHGKWDLSGNVTGKMDAKNIKVDGDFEGVNNYIFNESLDTFKFHYSLNEQVVKVKDFIAKKATGKLFSFLEYDILKKTADVWLKVTNLPITELSYYARSPLALQGLLNGTVSLKYNPSGWNGEGTVNLEDSNVLAENYADSSINLAVKDSEIKFNLNGFGRQILLETRLNLKDTSKPSFAKVNLDIINIKKLFGIFKGVDVINTEMEGSVKYSMRSEFILNNFTFQKIESNLTSLNLNKKPIFVSYRNPHPEIIVESGLIKKWDVNVRGKKFYVLSKGVGDFRADYDVTSNMKIDASIIEIFNSIVSKANGNIRGKVVYKVKGKSTDYQALLTSNNLALNTKFLPTAITKTDMRISFENSVLKIEKFIAQLVSGAFELKGRVDLQNVIPDIDVRYSFKDAGLSIMKKSNLIFSGSGSLIGKTFPYTLGGDFQIQKFALVNEISDFGGDSSNIITKNEIKYLPGAKKKAADNLFDLNLNIVTREPVYISNSIADLGFVGNLQILGGEKEPKLSGKISLAPRKNKVTFKNNEFNFTKGNVFFVDRNDFKNPELDFLATSSIGDYKVNVKVLGPVKNFDMNLFSEPALPQSDILSLIAFGYTEDLSNLLTEQDKESMTRASIGSMLFDSFKINETLKNEFGIQVNLGTDIAQEERSFLSQRNSGGNDDARVRSATTFEIRKKLSDSMSLSVSSTVGTNTSQRQSLNLNYNVNKKVSVEGVYESRSTDETETINADTSVGADLKVKWSFK